MKFEMSIRFSLNVLLIEDIQILLAYGLKSKLKHGSQLLRQFMTREASFSASFGMPAEFRIIVTFLDPYFNHLIFHFIICCALHFLVSSWQVSSLMEALRYLARTNRFNLMTTLEFPMERISHRPTDSQSEKSPK